MEKFKILVIFCLFIAKPGVFSMKYQPIGECQYTAQNEVTFMCTPMRGQPHWLDILVEMCLNNRLSRVDLAESIDFRNCDLRQFPSELFKQYRNMNFINATNINLLTIEADTFFGNPNLIKFIGSYNNLTQIPANMFKNNQKLTNLDFSFNKIEYFDQDAFAIGNNLSILNLSHNKINELNIKSFQKLEKLQLVKLSHNKLEVIPSFLFARSTNLTIIDLSWNEIKQIDALAFAGDFDLHHLNLSHNQLTNFFKTIVENHANLTHLDLSWNELDGFDSDSFETLEKLVDLNLSGNFIKSLANATFVNLMEVKNLNLSHNQLTEIVPGTFSKMTKLANLDLSKNLLKVVNFDIFQQYRIGLQWFSIAFNHIRELNGFNNIILPNVTVVGVDSNPFNCTYINRLFRRFSVKHFDQHLGEFKCITGSKEGEDQMNGRIETQIIIGDSDSVRIRYMFYMTASIAGVLIGVLGIAIFLGIAGVVCKRNKHSNQQYVAYKRNVLDLPITVDEQKYQSTVFLY